MVIFKHLCSRLGADSSADLVVYPAQLAGDPRVHPRGVSLGTSEPPGDNTDDGVVVALVGHHGSSAVSLQCKLNLRSHDPSRLMIGEYNLTRVLASVLGADHVGGDVRGGVGSVGCRALGIGHGVNINLQSNLITLRNFDTF